MDSRVAKRGHRHTHAFVLFGRFDKKERERGRSAGPRSPAGTSTCGRGAATEGDRTVPQLVVGGGKDRLGGRAGTNTRGCVPTKSANQAGNLAARDENQMAPQLQTDKETSTRSRGRDDGSHCRARRQPVQMAGAFAPPHLPACPPSLVISLFGTFCPTFLIFTHQLDSIQPEETKRSISRTSCRNKHENTESKLQKHSFFDFLISRARTPSTTRKQKQNCKNIFF